MKEIKTEPTKPYAHLRAGSVSVTIWSNIKEYNGKQFQAYSFQFQRSYKDDKGQWKNTDSFQLNDLPKINILTMEAFKKCGMGIEDAE